jgi:hypothetical protein
VVRHAGGIRGFRDTQGPALGVVVWVVMGPSGGMIFHLTLPGSGADFTGGPGRAPG